MTTHARPPLAVRLADLFRGHRRLPDPPRTWGAARWDHPDPAVYAGDPQVPEDAVYGDAPHPEPHPPWLTAPQPALTGPGALGTFYAAADLRDQRAFLDVPEGLVRPYAPEPEPVPEPVPEPGAVSYPPVDLHADLAECVIFRAAVQGHFVRQQHARGHRARSGETWLQEHARVYGERFTGELDDIARRATGAPLPDYRIAELWAAAVVPGGMIL